MRVLANADFSLIIISYPLRFNLYLHSWLPCDIAMFLSVLVDEFEISLLYFIVCDISGGRWGVVTGFDLSSSTVGCAVMHVLISFIVRVDRPILIFICSGSFLCRVRLQLPWDSSFYYYSDFLGLFRFLVHLGLLLFLPILSFGTTSFWYSRFYSFIS